MITNDKEGLAELCLASSSIWGSVEDTINLVNGQCNKRLTFTTYSGKMITLEGDQYKRISLYRGAVTIVYRTIGKHGFRKRVKALIIHQI